MNDIEQHFTNLLHERAERTVVSVDLDAVKQGPPTQGRAGRNNVALLGVAAATALVVVGGLVALTQTRDTDSTGSSVAPDTAVATLPEGDSATTVPITVDDRAPGVAPGASEVANDGELLDWVGTYSLVEGPARLTVPTDNGLSFVIEKTDTTVCVNGTSCGGLWEGETSFRPQTVASGVVLDEALSGDDRNKVYYWIVPTGVEVRLVDASGASFCETKATPATGLADATIWTCETRGSIDVDGMAILFVKEGQTHSMTYRSDGYEFN